MEQGLGDGEEGQKVGGGVEMANTLICLQCVHKGVCRYEDRVAEAFNNMEEGYDYPVDIRVGCRVFRAEETPVFNRPVTFVRQEERTGGTYVTTHTGEPR